MPRTPEVCPTVFCPHTREIRSSVLRVLHAAAFVCCVLFLLIILQSSLITVRAQSTTATLSGTVTDENGAVIPGAKIEVLNARQAVRRTATTKDDGTFSVPLLDPGTYTLKVEGVGFAPYVSDIVLNVNDLIRVKIELKIGDITQTVKIVAPGAVSESAAVGVVIDRNRVENLPLNGRSPHQLLTTIPGYVPTSTLSTEPGQFSFNGQRTNTNNFLVDGVSGNVSASSSLIAGQHANGSLPATTAFGGTNNLVSVDAMEEFKVQTSTYAAEFGRTPGAQISIVTRSGTNEFHGNLYEYFRNDVLDANDWFFNANGRAKTALRQNDFGGVIGGPVLLPRFGEGGNRLAYNGRNRTFFFFSYEGLRLRQPFFLITDVPSLAARQSASPAVRELLNAFPLPNGPENAALKIAEFSAAFSNPATLNATSIRIDHRVGQRFAAFGRYNDAPSEAVQRTGGIASINTLSFVKNRTRTLTLGTTFIFSSTINNELRANYSLVTGSSFFTLDSFGGAVVPSDSFFFPTFTQGEGQTPFFSLSLFTGRFTSVLQGGGADNKQRQFNIVDNFSVISGAHSLKFGVDYQRLRPLIGPRTYTQNLLGTLDDLLNGGMTAVVAAESEPREPVLTNLSLYGQDVWRVNPRFTLTYGLRWELNLPPSRHGNGPRTVTGIDNAATVALAPEGTPLFDATYNNFAPRFGLTYQLRQQAGKETTVRGGVGIFYDLATGQAGNAFGTAAFPYASSKLLFGVPFPLSLADATPEPLGTVSPFLGGAYILAFEPGFKLPYTVQFNTAVEQSLGTGQSASISYVGARGRRLIRKETLAAPPFVIDVMRNSATSDYNALQLQFQRRLTRHLHALASYSFSKSLDTGSKESTPLPSVTAIDPRQDRGPSDFDMRHVFSVAMSYDLPVPDTGRVGNAILGNWSIDSIVRAQSALPVNVTTSMPFFGTFSVARPDLVEGVPLYITDASAPGGRRINSAAFVFPPLAPDFTQLRQGTLGRNALRGFSLFQIDLTFRRQFNLSERVNVQFRSDIFNILNHPNFANPCSDLLFCGSGFGRSSTMFGRGLGSGGINGGFNPLYQLGGPRSIQFSLKLQY